MPGTHRTMLDDRHAPTVGPARPHAHAGVCQSGTVDVGVHTCVSLDSPRGGVGHHARGIATPGRGTGGPGAQGGRSALLGARCVRQRMREQRCPNRGLERRTPRASRAPGPSHRTPAPAQLDPAGPRVPGRRIPTEGCAASAAKPGPRSSAAADPDSDTAASLSSIVQNRHRVPWTCRRWSPVAVVSL